MKRRLPNSASWLRQARKKKGWTQADAAARLNVSQTYVSLLERGQRAPTRLAKRLERVYGLPTSAARKPVSDQDELARDLATLGYEPFGYLKGRATASPEKTLLTALTTDDLESRLTEALPWVVMTYPDLNWEWLVDRGKRRDVQNRLGYVVSLAREVAERRKDSGSAKRLLEQEKRLERSVLVQDDTLCHESMTRAERQWLQDNRPAQAKRWHVLTDLRADQLPYAA